MSIATLQRKRQEGFTIVELLIVIIVIAILAALVITAYLGIQQRARDAERQADVREIANAAALYATDNDDFPTCTQISDGTVDIDDAALEPPQGGTFQADTQITTDSDNYGCVSDSTNEGMEFSWWSEVDDAAQQRTIGDFQTADAP